MQTKNSVQYLYSESAGHLPIVIRQHMISWYNGVIITSIVNRWRANTAAGWVGAGVDYNTTAKARQPQAHDGPGGRPVGRHKLSHRFLVQPHPDVDEDVERKQMQAIASLPDSVTQLLSLL